MSVEKYSRRLRELVESAGFVLAVSLDQGGVFRILASDVSATVVASASVTGSGFRVFFHGERLQVSAATELVDVLERIKAAL